MNKIYIWNVINHIYILLRHAPPPFVNMQLWEMCVFVISVGMHEVSGWVLTEMCIFVISVGVCEVSGGVYPCGTEKLSISTQRTASAYRSPYCRVSRSSVHRRLQSHHSLHCKYWLRIHRLPAFVYRSSFTCVCLC